MCNRYIGTATFGLIKDGNLKIRGVKIPCGSWYCEDCAKRKKIILGNRVKEGLKNERIRFVTLTAGKKDSLAGMLRTLKSSWNRLRGTLVRKYGLSRFFWVVEFGHEGGRPHLHFLINCYIPQRALSKLAARAGFGPVVDIREVKDGGGFGYVFKYLGKDCGSRAGAAALRLARSRRFGCSRNIHPIREQGSNKICLEFLKDAIFGDYEKHSVELVASAVCKEIFTKTYSKTRAEIVGSPLWDETHTREFLLWIRSGLVQRDTLLKASSPQVGAALHRWKLKAHRKDDGLGWDEPWAPPESSELWDKTFEPWDKTAVSLEQVRELVEEIFAAH